ncbi:MarR family transcriptional regulator [Streptantibioticus parmotrematis]|uniref:MarR family transcriptional regulator n=1 Tax=Streptantibioticus parmotrematis TaxID=2873249 RepID=UPI0033C15086
MMEAASGGGRDADLETVHLLRQVTVELVLAQAEFARRNGMHGTDVRALICLLDAERAGTPATPGLLGAELGLNSAGTTAVIDRLERLGHVERVRDRADRRRVRLRVSAAAVALGESFFGPLIGGTVELLRGMDDTEAAAVRRFLSGVSELARKPAP